MRDAPWDEKDTLEVARIGEGETGKRFGQLLTARRLEAIAEWFALPRSQRDGFRAPRNILELARRLGCSPASVRAWQRDPRMLQRTIEKLRMAAVYSMPDVLEGQVKRASGERDTQAAKFVRTTAGMDPEPGGTQVNVGVSIRAQASESDQAFIQRFQASMSSHVLRQIAARRQALEPEQEDEEEDDEKEKGEEKPGDESVNGELSDERH